jgi:D-glycero-D-manno-heptose 1,7-bisphosphate phosphatase
MSSAARRAVFLDRDGTITKEGEWIKHPGALELIDGAAEAVRALHEAGYLVIMYSNQSAVARGMITEQELAAIHERLQQMLERRGDRLDAIYSCPHHPTEGVGQYRVVCDCRKPKPGLILRAQREMDIDLARSWCVGDMARDLEAGEAAGVRGILVATGKGQEEFVRLKAEGRAPRWFERDLSAAVSRILALEKGVALS